MRKLEQLLLKVLETKLLVKMCGGKSVEGPRTIKRRVMRAIRPSKYCWDSDRVSPEKLFAGASNKNGQPEKTFFDWQT